jgi:hypothetical protein
MSSGGRGRRIAALVTVVILARGLAQPSDPGLSIDASSPFVQVIFDHAGDRKPLSEFEPPLGLWLRLKNNSRLPVRVATFEPGTTDPGTGIADEVVVTAHPTMITGRPKQADQSSAVIADGKGYSRDVGSPATIPPGQSLLFSVPLNHVGPTCFLRIRFEFDLPPVKSGRQPYSFVDFTWSDVPSEVRQLWTKSQVR